MTVLLAVLILSLVLSQLNTSFNSQNAYHIQSETMTTKFGWAIGHATQLIILRTLHCRTYALQIIKLQPFLNVHLLVKMCLILHLEFYIFTLLIF
jgi:hypothetical protein